MAMKEEAVREVPATLASGDLVQARYKVESLLGQGDFGAVYLVRDQHEQQKLFVLAEVLDRHAEESYRFTLGYVAPTPLDQQALPAVQYVFNDDRLGRTYILMPYHEESTLEVLRLQQPEQRFPLPRVMALMVPVIHAVDYLHQQTPPVIHQNISPSNIIIPRTLQEPVLMMLGLVKDRDSTTAALPYFSPGYGAPEQYGEQQISPRSDIYALGATCYTLLTGRIPPGALDRSTRLQNAEVDPLPPLQEGVPTLPSYIVEAIQRSMALHADDRFMSVQQFKLALQADQGFQASPTQQLRLSVPLLEVTQVLPAPGRVPSCLSHAEPAAPEVAPAVSVALEPPLPAVVTSAPPASPPSPVIAEKARETSVEIAAAASAPIRSRSWKFGALLPVLALLIGLGSGAVFWPVVLIHSSANTRSPTAGAKASTLTPTPRSVSSTYPIFTGAYGGTIYDVARNSSTSMLLTGMRQDQEHVSGYLTLGSDMQGSGHFSGTIDSTKALEFVVTDSEGNAPLFFRGVMQSATALNGEYYSCNLPGPGQGDQCQRASGSYGIWDIVLLS
jgi:eukaryotic-like serine/threonine-protein kinase